MNYKTMIDAARANGRNDESIMNKSVMHISAFMDELKAAHPDKYSKFMRGQHVIINGAHYNAEFAAEDVAAMFHTDNGERIDGEHFTMNQAKDAAREWGVNNAADLYVAINANYHDKAILFKSWFDDDFEQKIIEDAVIFFFKDEDANNTKIWDYMAALK